MQHQNTAMKTNQEETKNPLTTLSDKLSVHMTEVDNIILKNMQSSVPVIPKLAQYLISAGGKRIRPLLTLASTALFNGDMEKSYNLAAAVEFIHSATLLHDDVVDESLERRGQKTANLIFGNQASVLVGDFLFSKSFQMMVESRSIEILSILSNAAAIIAQGEVLQLCAINNIETKMPMYLEIIESKTAALFAASCEVGAVISNQNEKTVKAMRNYGTMIGCAFQIIDDALDYIADQKKLGKEIGDDFREGKITAPVIYAMENANKQEYEFWQRTLGYKKQEDTDLNRAIELINKYGAIDKTIKLAQSYSQKACKELDIVPENEIKTLLCELSKYIITRNF